MKPHCVEVSGGGEAVSREAGYGLQTASDHYWSVAQYPGAGGIAGASAAYAHGSNPGVTVSEGLQVSDKHFLFNFILDIYFRRLRRRWTSHHGRRGMGRAC